MFQLTFQSIKVWHFYFSRTFTLAGSGILETLSRLWIWQHTCIKSLLVFVSCPVFWFFFVFHRVLLGSSNERWRYNKREGLQRSRWKVCSSVALRYSFFFFFQVIHCSPKIDLEPTFYKEDTQPTYHWHEGKNRMTDCFSLGEQFL